MSNSLRPHGLQPTRLLRPWDLPGKSTGVGCHCLLCSVTQWCPILCNQMDYSLLGSSVHGASPSKNTGVCCTFPLQENLPDPGTEPVSLALAGIFFNTEPPGKPHQHVLVGLGETVVMKEFPGRPRLPGEINSDMQMIPPLWQKAKRK